LYKGKSLTVDHISDLMVVKLLGKELENWDATPFEKSCLGCNHMLKIQIWQEPTRALG
jgi:hypothetical protein